MAPTDSMKDPTAHSQKIGEEIGEEIIGRLLDLFRRMQANFEATAISLGLTAAEAQALHHLDAPAPMRAMADSLCCDASYITVLADRLEARGLVNRVADPGDRRVKRLVLTEAGADKRRELIAATHASTPALVGLDARQRDALVGLLRSMDGSAPPT